jgi:hypothetical protein
MAYVPSHHRGRRRQGVVLLVVITMLSLFAAVGLGFVFYADAVANSSQLARETQDKPYPDIDPELLLSYFLGQLIYDTDNPYSALRGHSLARTMYGYIQNDNTNPANNPNELSFTPFSGVGRLHYNNAALGGDDYYFPNYQYYPADGFIRDPEYYGTRNPTVQAKPSYTMYRAGNAPYTYPDMNNMFLAQVNASGEVILPSFHRPWLSAANKYSVLYPSISYHTNFAVPDADLGGHVRNLDYSKGTKLAAGGYANNDSYWLDLGWPVLIAPNGKKYKALFAPLVVDLDSRINLWLAGNNYKNGTAHLSNKGYGPSEINLSKIVTTATELQWLFNQRFGPNGTPDYTAAPTQWPARDGPYYARIDFNADASTAPGYPLTLPNPKNPAYTTPLYLIFPEYPKGTLPGNAAPYWWTAATELTGHPLGYNIFQPTTDDRVSPQTSAYEAILRHKGTNAPSATSLFFKNMPTTFANDKVRGLLTSLSWNLDRITAAPYIKDAPSGTYANNYNPAQPPSAANKAYPFLANALTSPLFDGSYTPAAEFTAEYRSTLVARLRLNLNRISTSAYDYPTPVAGYIDLTNATNATQFTNAQQVRQQLAQDIYKMLILVTGAQDPNLPTSPPPLNSPAFNAARWLAQLAVNIVDYIDNDDIITPFQWYTDPASVNPPEYVYGTEPTRVVINEAYVQLDNDPTIDVGLTKATKYNVNVWVELHNPFKTNPPDQTTANPETYPFDNGLVRLNVTSPSATSGMAPAYQVVMSMNDTTKLRTSGNNDGSSSTGAGGAYLQTAPDPTNAAKNYWDPTTYPLVTILPASGAFSDPAKQNNGFYVLGPPQNFPPAVGTTTTRDPALPVSYRSPQMAVQLDANADKTTRVASLITNGTTILLRRLACPYLPPNNTAGSPTYNPYITVDYAENVKTYDNRVVDEAGTVLSPPAETTYSSVPRKQPYGAAYMSNVNANYTTSQPTEWNVANGQPLNTFFRHNSQDPTVPASGVTFTTPFYWLTHLDRPVVNAMELFHVSGFCPHLLTQQFITYDPTTGAETAQYQQYAPWTDQQAMIFRSLELLGVPSYLNGTTIAGRVPGKINLNTITDLEVFQALCDAQANFSSFNDNAGTGDVTQLFQQMLNSRMPGDPAAVPPIPAGSPSKNDVPFKSFTTAWVNTGDTQYPKGSGLQDTLLRNDPTTTTRPLFKLGTPLSAPTHPYQQWELLQKIYNNVTTTSNVFAVWVTVGFFEVDDSVTPPKILSEIGRDTGKQIRHRMFAVVDRSVLALFNAQTTAAVTAGKGQTVPINPANGTLPNGNAWAVQPGMFLEVGAPGNSEVVVVTSVGAGGVTADFTKSWPAGTPVVCRGNPGPNPTYNHRSDTSVVLHYTVIQ